MEIIIRDPLIEPFYIQRDEWQYSIIEIVTPKEKFSDTGGKPYKKYRTHHPSLSGALLAISKLKHPEKTEYDSFREYADEVGAYNEKLFKFIKEVIKI